MLEKNKTILLTGSGGFFGSNFVRRAIFNKLNYNLVSIDKVKKPKVIDNFYYNKNHSFYIGDVNDAHFINVIFEIERPDIVIHAADEDDIESCLKTNILGTQNIINACTKWKIEKILYVSTDKVYGQLTSDKEPAWLETSPINPQNSYAISKITGELLIKTSGIAYNIVRFCNNYGPRQDTNKLIPKIINNILNNKKTVLYGQGQYIRDWLHVFETCNAINYILNGPKNEIYNVSANQEISNIELYQEICNILNKGHNLLEFDNKSNNYSARVLNSNKLMNLGWKPEFKFKENLNLCVEWYINNQFWFKGNK